ncbi:MAPEG family protein [Bradyrhizobium sp. USDA 4353]
MTIAELCIFASVMLYLITIVPAKWISVDGAGRYDNSRPRDPAFYDGGIRERALGAHQNGIEAFPFFAAAVLLAEFRAAPQNLINELSVLFVIVRVAYVLTYIGDRPSLRSILWTIGFLITVGIFFLPLLRQYLQV